jgi:hypothetical protein
MGKNQRTQKQVQAFRDKERKAHIVRRQERDKVSTHVEKEVPQISNEVPSAFDVSGSDEYPNIGDGGSSFSPRYSESESGELGVEETEEESEEENKAKPPVGCKKCKQALKTRQFAQSRRGVRLKKVKE